MTEEKNTGKATSGCCEGPEFNFQKGKFEEMSRMRQQFCGEGGSFDCSEMMENFRGKDGSIDCSRMMEVMQEMFESKKEKSESE
jgi:hypothetical protein